MRLVYYALGGGYGHIARGLATLRALRRALPDARLHLFVPRHGLAWARSEGIAASAPPGDPPTRAELAAWLERELSELKPDRLAVDVFPRGILGEFSLLERRLPTLRYLVGRRIRPAFYLAPQIRRAIEGYRAVIWCERADPILWRLGRRSFLIPPVLIREPSECLSREQARRALGIRDDRRCLISLVRDRKRAHRTLEALSRADPGKRSRAWELIEAHRCPVFPAMRLLRGADLVMAAGGYNAYHETQCLSVPAVYRAEARLYDDQHGRIRSVVDRGAGGARRLAALLGGAAELPTRTDQSAVQAPILAEEQVAALALRLVP